MPCFFVNVLYFFARAIKNKQKITPINLFFTFLFSHVKRCYGKLFTVIKEQISHPDLTSTSHSLH